MEDKINSFIANLNENNSSNNRYDSSRHTSLKRVNKRYDVLFEDEDDDCFKYQSPFDDLKIIDSSPASTSSKINNKFDFKKFENYENDNLPTTSRANKPIIKLGELLDTANKNISNNKMVKHYYRNAFLGN